MYVNALASFGRGSGVDHDDVKVSVAVRLDGATNGASPMGFWHVMLATFLSPLPSIPRSIMALA
jgi:hypothetical protein